MKLPEPGEVDYRVFTDDFSNQFFVQIISPAGAIIQMSCPRNTNGFSDLTQLIDDFYRHITEIGQQLDFSQTV